ncbi:MAG: Sec-independent protein translocase protein TatB [Pseudomonadota bacterium]
MFDIGTSELLIIGIVTLLAVGPKDLPVFLRTVGKYVAAIRKQAGEFRTHFDEAMRETELDQLRKDVSNLKSDVVQTVRDATGDVEREFNETKSSIKAATSMDHLSQGAHGEAAVSASETSDSATSVNGNVANQTSTPPSQDPLADGTPAGAAVEETVLSKPARPDVAVAGSEAEKTGP